MQSCSLILCGIHFPQFYKFLLFNVLTLLESFYRMFEKPRGCTLTKRNLVCSIITISENATPMTLIQGNGSSGQLQEARAPVFSSATPA